MIVKIKCGCGAKRVIKKDTLKEARQVKRAYKKRAYICDKCYFRILASRVAKEIVEGV